MGKEKKRCQRREEGVPARWLFIIDKVAPCQLRTKRNDVAWLEEESGMRNGNVIDT